MDLNSVLTINHTKEALSCAFVAALAARAGVILNIGETFDYGVDGHFRDAVIFNNRRRCGVGITLDFQLKATTKWSVDPGLLHINYDVEVKAYNDIAVREPEETKMILIVLCLPHDEIEWVAACNDNLLLKHCCYWYDISGGVLPKPEDQRHTIAIPMKNLLDPLAVKQLLLDERSRRVGLMR